MCQKVFEIVRSMDLKNVEIQLALQCAPLITGIKVSNLLMVDSSQEVALALILNNSEVSYYKLLQSGEKSAFLLFDRIELENYLNGAEVKEMLAEYGYEDFSLEYILEKFGTRYEAYLCQGDGLFPHEMGLILGYPVDDVAGFISNEGRDSLYSGYWKVYKDVANKKRLFDKYEEAKECLIQLLAEGIEMRLILDIYKKEPMHKVAV